MLLSNVDERSTYFRDLFISQPCIIIHFRGKGCLERKREERKKGGGGGGRGGREIVRLQSGSSRATELWSGVQFSSVLLYVHVHISHQDY